MGKNFHRRLVAAGYQAFFLSEFIAAGRIQRNATGAR
jgi:hypothetical protein